MGSSQFSDGLAEVKRPLPFLGLQGQGLQQHDQFSGGGIVSEFILGKLTPGAVIPYPPLSLSTPVK